MTSRWIRVGLAMSVWLLLIGIGYVGSERASAQGTAAQLTPVRRVSATITQVKPDMITSYQALVKGEGIPAEKKAGVAWRATYRPVFGELNTFVTVRPVTNYAQHDSPNPLVKVLGQEAASRYLTQVQAMTTSQRRMIQTLQSTLSIESGCRRQPVSSS